MMNKRKRVFENGGERQTKRRQRRRKRSSSEPLLNDPNSSVKLKALKRLFGRVRSVDENQHQNRQEVFDEPNEGFPFTGLVDENDDPLLDSVPVNMDPEQLGFLVCAQETLSFLNRRGIPPHHPMFANLRLRLLRGIGELAMA